MAYSKIAHNKQEKIEAVLSRDVETLSYRELEDGAALLREEADRLMGRILHQKLPANDTLEDLQGVLEMRYGGGFAQWVMDRMLPASRP